MTVKEIGWRRPEPSKTKSDLSKQSEGKWAVFATARSAALVRSRKSVTLPKLSFLDKPESEK